MDATLRFPACFFPGSGFDLSGTLGIGRFSFVETDSDVSFPECCWVGVMTLFFVGVVPSRLDFDFRFGRDFTMGF